MHVLASARERGGGCHPPHPPVAQVGEAGSEPEQVEQEEEEVVVVDHAATEQEAGQEAGQEAEKVRS